MSDIKTGFTGELEDRTTVKAQVKRAATAVQREAGAVAATAQDHRAATGSVLLLVGAAAFLAGYVLGTRERRDRWDWRSWR
ncbi:hypothetical protein ASG39_03345 [Rhizobium sp. Leaf371]|uniref:hypothetical protein n=1 Tax=Rhizobium sp. Leaf371 TaxID=1736355 RepID=UPI0007130649|nr:hypothetical protein [Rhizobium sp. Leaf371]KQS72790.1 hypothetical protein ASG39_03345 [Rhizobium sp. Leaf371]